MTKCEFIDLTLSDSDSDGDFIQSKKATHLFLYQASVCYKCLLHQASTTTEITSQDLCMYVVSIVVSRSQPGSFAYNLPEAGSFASRCYKSLLCTITCLCWQYSAKPCMHLYLNCTGNKNSTQSLFRDISRCC